MTKQKFIESKIREACPELMELTFGCYISNSKNYRLQYVGYNNRQHCISLWKDGEQSLLFVDKVNTEEIIGHPIHLEHVLRAMQTLSNDNWQRHWVINRWGEFLNDAKPEIAELPVAAVGETYDLTLTFEQNMENEELLNFLYEILQ